MPNWNYNSVEIHATQVALKTYLVPKDDGTYRFNMHLLFPDRFPETDPIGEANWDYDWAVENTGSKWFPEVELCSDETCIMSWLHYDTARAPNNETLRRLHELTGWTITNEYEEPGVGFEGTFNCRDGDCHNDERDYQPLCDVCQEKQSSHAYTLDEDGYVCDTCLTVKSIS